MVEKVILDKEVKGTLKQEQSKAINMYYRAEGTFMFSLITLLLCIFLWDTIQDPLFFMVFSVVFNFLLMMFFLWQHMEQKGVLK